MLDFPRNDNGHDLRLAYLAAGGVLVFVAAAWLSRATVFGVWPDVITLFALYQALYGDGRFRYVPCLGLGFMRDLLSAVPPGTHAILYALMHKAVAPRTGGMQRGSLLIQTVLALACVIGVQLGCWAVLAATRHGVGWGAALWNAALTAAVSAPLMPVMAVGLTIALQLARVRRDASGAVAI
jgi:hypothetical protein